MVFKRIDRYVSGRFLVRFLGSLLIVFGLYMSFDVMSRIEQIQNFGLFGILRYYAYFFPAVLLGIVPPLLLVGAGITLVQMLRSRELLVMMASGVSLRRVSAPIFGWAVVVAVLIFWTEENVVPYCASRYKLLENELTEEVDYRCVLRDPVENMVLYVESYDFAGRKMGNVHLMQFSPDRTLKALIEADSGVWYADGSLVLSGVTTQLFDQNGARAGKPQPSMTERVETSLRPYDLTQAKEEGTSTRLPALDLKALRRKIRENPNVPQYRVMLHGRLAAPFVPFILLLVGIPLLVGFEHSLASRVLGVILCLAVATAFQALSFVFASMGNTGAIHPVLAGWFPVALMGPVGLWSFSNMRT